MAFKLKKRLPGCCDPDPVEPIVEDENVLATQSWVHRIIDRMLASWTSIFRTGTLDVTGTTSTQTLISDDIRTNRLLSNQVVLLDETGKPMRLVIRNGKLDVVYDLKMYLSIQRKVFLSRVSCTIQDLQFQRISRT